MKKLYPEAPDVPQGVANRAAKIIERHLRVHHASRVQDLPEEAQVRLYRDLRFFFEVGSQPPDAQCQGKGFSIKRFFTRLWEQLEDILSASEAERPIGLISVCALAAFGEPSRWITLPWTNNPPMCGESI